MMRGHHRDRQHCQGSLPGREAIGQEAQRAADGPHPANRERLFKLLVEAVVDYAVYMLDPAGRVATWNAGAARMKGYSEAEVLGQHFRCFFTEPDRAAGVPERALEEARQTGRSENEGWRQRKDGSHFWALAILDAIRDPAGELIGFAKITRDITERRAAQHALEQAREALYQRQKLETVGQLTGGVAHDFNNLLTVIRGGLELAAPEFGEQPRLQRLHGAMVAATERAEALTRQLLAFSRRQQLHPVALDLAVRLAETGALLRDSFDSEITLVTDFPAGIHVVEADPTQLELAVLNLGLNARDAMPAGGTLTVSLANVRLEDALLGLAGDYVEIRMTDTGIGIPAELIARAIEPFYTTKEVGKGSGLGLSQAYGFARQSGGNLVLQSSVGQGTTVRLTLPARPAAPAMVRDRGEPG